MRRRAVAPRPPADVPLAPAATAPRRHTRPHTHHAPRAGKAAFVADFGEEGYEEISGGWRAKLKRVAAGEQRWGLFVARKPAAA
jgi:hypothetical protein